MCQEGARKIIIQKYGNVAKKVLAVIICISVMCVSVVEALAAHKDYNEKDIQSTIENIINWEKQQLGVDKDSNLLSALAVSAGTTAGDWYAFSVGRLGIDDDYFSYLTVLQDYVESKYKTADKLDKTKSTEWHRIALTVLSLGGDPTAFGKDTKGNSINLISDGTYNRANLSQQGVNSYIWALITLDSNNYAVPDSALNTRESIIDGIISYQSADGGFSTNNGESSIDITAMAVQALAPYADKSSDKYEKYKKHNVVDMAVDKAVNWLSKQQQADGSFKQDGEACAESTAQVLTALCCSKIDAVNDSRFIKNGNNVLDGIMLFKAENGGFSHTMGKSANAIAGQQVLYSLCALYRMWGGYNTLYDITDENNSGEITNIFTDKKVSSKVEFNDYDVQQYKNLTENLTTEYYSKVLMLYKKLLVADNADSYKSEEKDLKEKLDYLTSVRTEIEDINSIIANKLYPFDNILQEDKELIDSLCSRADKLSEYDQKQILGIDNLRQAQAELNTRQSTTVVAVAVTALVVLLVIVLLIGIAKKRKANKQQQLENDEW
ncbi:prenyltransferase/squalene oxidase repeat-containing protein [Oscillospiraceae bacterium LCP25S3_E10]